MIPIVVVLVFAGASFFFSLAETSLFSLSKWQVRRLADQPSAAGGLVAELIRAGGYEPVRVGGLDQSIRIEMFGDLHEYGALGRVVTKSEALAAV